MKISSLFSSTLFVLLALFVFAACAQSQTLRTLGSVAQAPTDVPTATPRARVAQAAPTDTPAPTRVARRVAQGATATASIPVRSATLSEILNLVETRAGGGDFVAATEGARIIENDQVRTGAGARARLDFSEGTIVRLGANTLLTVKTLAPSSTNPFSQILLQTGKIWSSLFGGAIEVETPVGIASVRGSFGSVEYDAGGDRLTMNCIEGDCRFTNGETVIVNNLERLLVTNGGTAFEREQLTAADVQEFIRTNPEAVIVAATLTAIATQSVTVTPTRTATTTLSPIPSATTFNATAEPTQRGAREPSDTPIASETPLPTNTSTRDPNVTDTPTRTRRPSRTPTATSTDAATATDTATPSQTPTATATDVTAVVLCVDDDGGATTAPCTNPAAYMSIQAALDDAPTEAFPTVSEIRIAEGTYTSTGSSVAEVNKNLILTGGFVGFPVDWTAPAGPGLTFLDGENARPTIAVSSGISATVQNITLANGGISNDGTMFVEMYPLYLGGGTSYGNFDVALTGLMKFASGTHTLQGGTHLYGAGNYEIETATVNIAGAVDVENMRFLGGTLTGAGPLNVSTSFGWTAGLISVTQLDITTGAMFDMHSANPKQLDAVTFNMAGTGKWSDMGDWYVSNGTVINNSGQFYMDNDQQLIDAGGTPSSFENTGFFNKQTATGDTNINIKFDNDGNVVADSGNIVFVNGGASTGTFSGNGTGVIEFSSNTYNMNAGTIWTGNTLVNGAIVNVNVNIAADSVELVTGNLAGAGDLTVNAEFLWHGGNMNGTGATKTTATAHFEINNPNPKLLDTRKLELGGPSDWYVGSGVGVANGALIKNGGNFTIHGDDSFVHTGGTLPSFENNGTLTKASGAGSSLFGVSFLNKGTVQVDSGGMTFPNGYTQTLGDTKLNGGNLTTTTFDLQAGGLRGSGTVTGDVLNSGVVSPGNVLGGMTIAGSYTQNATGQLNIEIGGPTAVLYDLLAVTNTAGLNGTLNLTTTNGFVPTTSDFFVIVTFLSKTGAFSTVNGINFTAGRAFVVNYLASEVKLTVVNVP